MKRTIFLLILLVVCAAAVFAAPYYLKARETTRRHEAYVQMLANSKPLVLDAKTQAILAGADRVETFRLQGGDEDEDASGTQSAAYASPQYLEDHLVIDKGPIQGRAFAGALQAALVQGTSEPDYFQCFMPGVGFRAWQGKRHTDICICFTCQGVENCH